MAKKPAEQPETQTDVEGHGYMPVGSAMAPAKPPRPPMEATPSSVWSTCARISSTARSPAETSTPAAV